MRIISNFVAGGTKMNYVEKSNCSVFISTYDYGAQCISMPEYSEEFFFYQIVEEIKISRIYNISCYYVNGH